MTIYVYTTVNIFMRYFFYFIFLCYIESASVRWVDLVMKLHTARHDLLVHTLVYTMLNAEESSCLLVIVITHISMYTMIKSNKSPSFCMTISSWVLQTFQSHDCSHYVSKWILATPPLWLQKHMRAEDFTHSPCFWHQSRFSDITCA